jgi:hypothetical protein
LQLKQPHQYLLAMAQKLAQPAPLLNATLPAAEVLPAPLPPYMKKMGV